MIEPVRPSLRALTDDRPDTLDLRLRVVDPEVVADLVEAGEGSARDALALQALKIGLLALRQARGRIDADAVRREGERILSDLKARLESHGQSVHERIQTTLRDYFDPKDGRFETRVRKLIERDGELESVLRRHVGGADSEIAKTLAAHVGQASPLMAHLSADKSDGLVKLLEGMVGDALDTQRERILSEFSLDSADSALKRFLEEVDLRSGKLGESLQLQISTVVGEFSLDKPDSALSRLVGRVETAQRTISKEFSLDEKGSALFRMKDELLGVFSQHAKVAADFQQEVRSTLEAMKVRKAEAARSTRHGLAFEDDVWSFVERRALAAADVPERCGATPGLVARCKTGDCMVTLGTSRAAAGSRIVVEAKKMAGWTLAKAVVEIEEARRNRGAQSGVFVFSTGFAPDGLPRLLRHGDDVFVAWDAEDAASDVYLDAALSVAEALCTRIAAQTEERTQDLEVLDRAVNEIQKQAGFLDEIEGSANHVTLSADKIARRVQSMRKTLSRGIEDLRDGLRELRAD